MSKRTALVILAVLLMLVAVYNEIQHGDACRLRGWTSYQSGVGCYRITYEVEK